MKKLHLLVGVLFLCDINGNTLDYSHCINTVLDIPYRYSGIIILRI